MATHTADTAAPPRWWAALLRIWSSRRAERASLVLLSVAYPLLFLSAAATLEVGFTLQISYAAAAAAVAVGAPFVLRGWQRLPSWLAAAAVVLVAVFAAAALLGEHRVLASQPGRSHLREVVYLTDLVLGLALLGLTTWHARTPGRVRRLAGLVALGAVAAALVATYQWFARHYHLPLADINDTVNSDGFSRGYRYQGAGLFGWERARGTFKEPMFLAAHLAATLPVLCALWLLSRQRRRLRAGLGAAAVLCAIVLALTVSSLTWGVLVVAAAGTLTLVAAGRGRPAAAALAGGLATLLVVLGPVLFFNARVLASATGRSATELQTTTDNRTQAWSNAVDAWAERPLIGHGPGQSSVLLAYVPDGTAIAPGVVAPEVLGSAQGVWAASLVDAGIPGLTAWLLLLGGLAGYLAAALWRRPSPLLAGLIMAAAVSILGAQFAGDRLDLRVWLLSGLACAAASQTGRRERAERHQ